MGRYALVRGVLFVPALILAHATVVLWKMFDPGQITVATWVVETIYRPIIHKFAVWLVINFLELFGSFGQTATRSVQTYLRNNPPTHHDADKVFYSLLLVTFIWILYVIGTSLTRLVWNRGGSGHTYAPRPRPNHGRID
jgi:hypothetical protein